jgi:hypothetical protein
MRSFVVSFLLAAALAAAGGFVAASSAPLEVRLVAAVAAVFLVDAVGGRWFGFASVALLFAGLAQDASGQWVRLLPLLVGSALAALFVRHAEPGWLGAPLVVAAFALPAVAFLVFRPRLDAGFEVPLGTRYLQWHALAAVAGVVAAGLVPPLRRALGRAVPARPARAGARVGRRVP